MAKANGKAKAKAKRLILVIVEGGIVQEVTHAINEEWDVWDWDDFKDDPLGGTGITSTKTSAKSLCATGRDCMPTRWRF